MEEQFRPKETVGGSSPSRGTTLEQRHCPSVLSRMAAHVYIVHMKWLIAVFGADPTASPPEPRALAEMIRGMRQIDVDLRSSGELVVEQGLDLPSNARVVRGDVRAGSYAPPPFSVQSFCIVGDSDEQRAVEIAQQISDIAFGAPVEIRRALDSPE